MEWTPTQNIRVPLMPGIGVDIGMMGVLTDATQTRLTAGMPIRD